MNNFQNAFYILQHHFDIGKDVLWKSREYDITQSREEFTKILNEIKDSVTTLLLKKRLLLNKD